MNNNRDQRRQFQPNSLSSISESIGGSTTDTAGMISSSAAQAQNSIPSDATAQKQMEQLGPLLASILNSQQNNNHNYSRQLPIQSPIMDPLARTLAASAPSQVHGNLPELLNMIMSASGTTLESNNTIIEILKQQIGILSLGRLQELLGLHTKQQNNNAAAPTGASVGATSTTPSESQLKPPADLRSVDRTTPTSNTSTTAIIPSEQSLQNRPDIRRVPCGARAKIPPDHNSQTAYFMIPSNTRHGQPLICSHLECRKEGVKFLYCVVCGVPVAKRFFRNRHKHDGIVPVGTIRTDTENSYETAVLNETHASSGFPTHHNTTQGAINNSLSINKAKGWYHTTQSPKMAPAKPGANIVISGLEGREEDPRGGAQYKRAIHHSTLKQIAKKVPPIQAPRATDHTGIAHNVASLSKGGPAERKRPFPDEVAADKHRRHDKQQERRKSKKRRNKHNNEDDHRGIGKEKQVRKHQTKTTAMTLGGSAVIVEDPKNKDIPESIRVHHRVEHKVLRKPERKSRLYETPSRKEPQARLSSRNTSSINNSNDRINPLPDLDAVRQREWAYLLDMRPQINDDGDGVMSWLQRVVAVSDKSSGFARQQKPSKGVCKKKAGSTSSQSSDSTNELDSTSTDCSGSIEDDDTYCSNLSTSSTVLSAEENVKKGNSTNQELAASQNLRTKSTKDPPFPLTKRQEKEKLQNWQGMKK